MNTKLLIAIITLVVLLLIYLAERTITFKRLLKQLKKQQKSLLSQEKLLLSQIFALQALLKTPPTSKLLEMRKMAHHQPKALKIGEFCQEITSTVKNLEPSARSATTQGKITEIQQLLNGLLKAKNKHIALLKEARTKQNRLLKLIFASYVNDLSQWQKVDL